MKLIIKLFAILAILIGILLLINPEIVFGLIERNKENTSFYILVVTVRLAIGLIFIMAAKESRYPSIIKFFGYLTMIAALIFVLKEQGGFQEFVSSLIPEVRPHAFLTGLIDIAVGSFLIYAFSNVKNQSKD